MCSVFDRYRSRDSVTNMAKCEEGYLCGVCGKDVDQITDSQLYLSYVIGELDPELLHTTRDHHLRCNPVLAQFIVDEQFPPIQVDGEFNKRDLDPQFVRQREILVTRGYRRLREIQGLELPILEYPLSEVRARMEERANELP
jgi:hypothetical protein